MAEAGVVGTVSCHALMRKLLISYQAKNCRKLSPSAMHKSDASEISIQWSVSDVWPPKRKVRSPPKHAIHMSQNAGLTRRSKLRRYATEARPRSLNEGRSGSKLDVVPRRQNRPVKNSHFPGSFRPFRENRFGNGFRENGTKHQCFSGC